MGSKPCSRSLELTYRWPAKGIEWKERSFGIEGMRGLQLHALTTWGGKSEYEGPLKFFELIALGQQELDKNVAGEATQSFNWASCSFYLEQVGGKSIHRHYLKFNGQPF